MLSVGPSYSLHKKSRSSGPLAPSLKASKHSPRKNSLSSSGTLLMATSLFTASHRSEASAQAVPYFLSIMYASLYLESDTKSENTARLSSSESSSCLTFERKPVFPL